MAANLNKVLAKLQFTNDEHVAIIDTTASQDASMLADVEFGLVGKVLSPKLVNETSFIRVFTNLWADEHVEIFPLKLGVFLFKFLREKDSLNILKRGPWIFDGVPIVLVHFVPSMVLRDCEFLKMTWWICVYELALNKMSLYVAMKIGKNADGTNLICLVQYEKLDKFCFNCGLLGHEVELCLKQIDKNASSLPYGYSLAQSEAAMTVGKDLATSGIDIGANVSVPQSLKVSSRSKNKVDSHGLNLWGDKSGDDDTLPIAQVLKGRVEVAKKVQHDDSTVEVAFLS
ncbi:hypothetical protein V6N11_034740 [Hibiscus sabdariffa]|uniref:Uncharacterized protein n=2 Tax=Hibiscus sabdariffa TaxID=183260 RepID=A0ABR2NRN0_9ROSI